MPLTKDDVDRGMQAVYSALGPEKGAEFFRAIATGALDPHFMTRVNAFLRQNPEVVRESSVAFGAALGQLVAAFLNPRVRPPQLRLRPPVLPDQTNDEQTPPERPQAEPIQVEVTSNRPVGHDADPQP